MRSAATAVENSFVKGLVTEASGLNFPENACTETSDCIFNYDGTVERRQGFEFETGSLTKNIARAGCVVSTYLWKNVAGNGDVSVYVVQFGGTLYFWRLPTTGALSSGAVSATVTLSTFQVAGSPDPSTIECQYASGNGLLFVTHPYCETFYITYNTSTDAVTTTQLTLSIRDLQGDTADPISNTTTTRPTSTLAALDVHHHYNLLNQGWTDANLTTWDGARTDMPNNIDVMWTFKNSSETFDTTLVDKIVRGNTPAPKGHFILNLYNQDRDTASGLTGTTSTNTSYQRVSTCCFFAGRVFYAGINYVGYNSNIYFTQIVERPEQYGFCYQQNDMTSQDLFDLGPADGGYIQIPEAGTIIKLVTISGGLLIFAQQGVWFVSGSTGLGFAANDYNVTKISSVQTLSSSSFVDIGGYPGWWNGDGIYLVGPPSGGAITPTVHPLTFLSIRTAFNDIPLQSKGVARGEFNYNDGTVRWLYRSTETSVLEQKYEFDRMLTYNIFTQAFYTWTVSAGGPTINGLLVMPVTSGSTSKSGVIDGASDRIVDGSGNPVVVYSSTALVRQPEFKFLTSYPSGASYAVTFSGESNSLYLDWLTYTGTGVDYTSYFVTGYKIHGQGLRTFQPSWVNIFAKTIADPASYYFQSRWDYANDSTTGRWSSRQYVFHNDTRYDYTIRHMKIRGNGKVLQFKVSSVTGQPFTLAGWSSFETSNAVP